MSSKKDLELLKLISDYVEQCYQMVYELYYCYYYEDVAADIALLVLGFKAIKEITDGVKKEIEKMIAEEIFKKKNEEAGKK